jgi:hypothetical protein
VDVHLYYTSTDDGSYGLMFDADERFKIPMNYFYRNSYLGTRSHHSLRNNNLQLNVNGPG